MPNKPRTHRKGRDFIARHGETVFNMARRLQGDHPHTPLTRAGFAQADEIGRAMRAELGARPPMTLWASSTGRALQTLAVIAEHLELDWHQARTDDRLVEIHMGELGGCYYADVLASGELTIVDGLFANRAPGGEWYDEIAARVSGWLDETDEDEGDRLVIMHGISSRVLRGLMTGADVKPELGTPVAPGTPQGTVTVIERGIERVVHLGAGHAPA